MIDTILPKLTPLPVVLDAARAIDVYIEAFAAREVVRHMNRTRGTVSNTTSRSAGRFLGDGGSSRMELGRAGVPGWLPRRSSTPGRERRAAFKVCKAGAAVVCL